MATLKASASDVISVLPFAEDQIGGASDRVTGTEIDTYLAEAESEIQALLNGTSATLSDPSEVVAQNATREYAAWQVMRAMDRGGEDHREAWRRRFDLLKNQIDDLGDVQTDDAIVATNESDGAEGSFHGGDRGSWDGW